jgi:hypothetical protein
MILIRGTLTAGTRKLWGRSLSDSPAGWDRAVRTPRRPPHFRNRRRAVYAATIAKVAHLVFNWNIIDLWWMLDRSDDRERDHVGKRMRRIKVGCSSVCRSNPSVSFGRHQIATDQCQCVATDCCFPSSRSIARPPRAEQQPMVT